MMCKAYGNTCGKCQKKHHYPSVCRASKPKVSSIATPDRESTRQPVQTDTTAEVSHVASFFSLGASDGTASDISDPRAQTLFKTAPASVEDLSVGVHYLRQTKDGPVTTLPLPHYVHDLIEGWIQTKPSPSPTLQVTFSVDRQAYAELTLPMPKLAAGHHPGRCGPIPSVCDTGAQLTVIPQSLLSTLRVKPETIFPVQTKINGVANSPLLVNGGILLTISAYHSTTETTYSGVCISQH